MDIRRSNESQGGGESAETSNTQSSSGGSQPQGSGSGIGGVVVSVVVLIVLVGAGIYFFGDQLNTGNSGGDVMGGDGPVARVAGEPIERSVFNEQISSLREATSSQAQQFQSLSETRQQELVLNGLINEELLRQAAINAGISVSDSEVDEQLQSQIEQIGGQEAFARRLSENDLTEEEVRSNLRDQLLINNYVTQASGTTTDQQIQQLYDQYTARLEQATGTSSNQNIPSLEQIRPQLEASIQQRNQQQLLQQARENIEVEVLLDGVSYPPTNSQQTSSQQQGTGQQQPPSQQSTGGTGAGN